MNKETVKILGEFISFVEDRLLKGREIAEKEVWVMRQSGNFSGLKELGEEIGKSDAYVDVLKELRRVVLKTKEELEEVKTIFVPYYIKPSKNVEYRKWRDEIDSGEPGIAHKVPEEFIIKPSFMSKLKGLLRWN